MSNFDHSRPGTVYALTDPRTGAIRYIGATQLVPAELRLRAHIRQWGGPCRSWIDELGAKGLEPGFRRLMIVAGSDLHAAERQAIIASAKNGFDLINVEGNPRAYAGQQQWRAARPPDPMLRMDDEAWGERVERLLGLA